MRTIKPEAFSSETLAMVPVRARWTFAGLWCHADDDGRCKANVGLIKAAIYPLDDDMTVKEIESDLDDLEAHGLICRYEASGKRYMHVVSFSEHQHPNRRVNSRLPSCPRTAHGGLSAPNGSTHAHLTEDAVSPHGGRITTSFTNTPSPTATSTTKGDGVGDGDGDGDVASAEPPTRDDIERLCAHLADRIEGNGSNRPEINQRWRDAARLMLDKDHRTEEQIRKAINWSQDHEFWRSNILSMPKLRERYEQLRLQAKRPGGGQAQGSNSHQPYRNPEDQDVYDA